LANELAAIYLDECRGESLRRGPRCTRVTPRSSATPRRDEISSARLGATELASACEAAELAAERRDVVAAAECLMAVEARYAEFAGWLVQQAGADWEIFVSSRVDETGGSNGREPPIVAVIEDNRDNRMLLDAILGDDFVIDEYAAGAEALIAMPARVPDVVLLDVAPRNGRTRGSGANARRSRFTTCRSLP
jgi:hypothetical protein